jgi:hypothetical protein
LSRLDITSRNGAIALGAGRRIEDPSLPDQPDT